MIPKDRMEEIIVESLKYSITLASDPTSLGPKYLQDQIATCRNYTNHTARLMNEVNKAAMNVDYELRRKETAFKIQADELLSNNAHVRNLPNITDRQAQINLLLRDELRVIEELRNSLKDLSHVEKIVKTTHRELKDTMNEIKLQRSLIRDEYETGRMYGDERPVSVSAPPTTPLISETFDDKELDVLLGGDSVTESGVPDTEAEKVPEPTVEPKTDEELMAGFVASSDEDDMNEIFSQMEV